MSDRLAGQPEGRVLVEATDLTVRFPIPRTATGQTELTAVNQVSLGVRAGETVALVGESGSGKSTLGRALIGLRSITSGDARFDGVSLTSAGKSTMRQLRRRMQIVFQDPYGSLDPRMTAGRIISEPIRTLESGLRRQEVRSRTRELMALVGLTPDMEDRYPHEFSGGQRQRIAIARALAVRPDFIVCDEPVSALDVSIQAQVLNLLLQLQAEYNLTYLFIAHDLAVVRKLATRVAVMYLGRIVEEGPKRDIYERPLHPYTVALLSAIPIPDPAAERVRERIVLSGDIPSPASPPSGCAFRTRCWLYRSLDEPEVCRSEVPRLPDDTDHRAACHFQDRVEITRKAGTSTDAPTTASGLEGR